MNLDPVIHAPMQTGPSVDHGKEQALPLYRREPFQLVGTKSRGVRLRGHPRPITTRMIHALDALPVNSMTVRKSNFNPAMAGLGDETSVVQEAAPVPESLLTAGVPRSQWIATLALGAGIGWLLYRWRRNSQ